MSVQVPLVCYLALGEHPRLVAGQCRQCGARFFDRRNACASCGGQAGFDAVALPEEGILRTFTIVSVAAPGVPVATLVANGEADLGFQQLSELIGQPGVKIVGPLPPEIQAVTVFSAGVASNSPDPEAARALVVFLASPETGDTKRRYGMEPA